MKFGKIHDIQIIEQLKWDLPPLDEVTSAFLEKEKRASSIKLKVGAPAWNHKEWVGKIYSLKTPSSKYLYFYSRYFNTIELNTTHYRIPTLEQAKKWCAEVPDDFVFCPKVFQEISHERSGLMDSSLLKVWFEFLESLQEKCGPCLMQLPPYFDYSHKALLFKFLQNWPQEFNLALEFRHPSWFQSGRILPALTQYLQSRGIGLVITDVAGRRDVLHSSISSEFTMIRFVGNSLHMSDYERAQLWNDRLKIWDQQGLQEIIFFVHQPDDIFVPEMTEYFKNLDFFKTYFVSQDEPQIASEPVNLSFLE